MPRDARTGSQVRADRSTGPRGTDSSAPGRRPAGPGGEQRPASKTLGSLDFRHAHTASERESTRLA